MVSTEWPFLLDCMTVSISLDLPLRVEEMLLENPAPSNCEIVLLETGSGADIPLEFDMTVVIEKRVIVEIARASPVFVYQAWC